MASRWDEFPAVHLYVLNSKVANNVGIFVESVFVISNLKLTIKEESIIL
jgi:hypothetical protein